MDVPLKEIARICKADKAEFVESIQRLWSGYGEILRVRLLPQDETVVVKFVSPPPQQEHKYGWTGDVSHQRKLSSYENELSWYRGAAKQCDKDVRIARLIGSSVGDQRWTFAFEDLDAAGFAIRRQRVSDEQLASCLRWLASLHAKFMTDSDSAAAELGLWPVGTYWHLATRPDELNAMPAGNLKESAAEIDNKLNGARYQTVVHGDAKLANFCFSEEDKVAAVDFQYVGGGCGMKDFAYFISSCFSDGECEQREEEMLKMYFGFLSDAIADDNLSREIEDEWRSLYAFAWADFHRFLAGWSPGHWKIHRYTQRLTQQALDQL